MLQLAQINKRIQHVGDLESVVSTMKSLAAVGIRHFERVLKSLERYQMTIDKGLKIALWDKSEEFFKQHISSLKQPKLGAIIIGSDHGLCGHYNSELCSYYEQFVTKLNLPQSPFIFTVGIKVNAIFFAKGGEGPRLFKTPNSVEGIDPLIEDLLQELESEGAKSGLEKILVFYHRRTGPVSSQPQWLQLLPLDLSPYYRRNIQPQSHWPSRQVPQYSMDQNTLLTRLFRHKIYITLFRCCAEALSSESANRLGAMQAAEKSIGERLDELRHSFHHLRQSAITEELLEILNAYDVLQKKSRKLMNSVGP